MNQNSTEPPGRPASFNVEPKAKIGLWRRSLPQPPVAAIPRPAFVASATEVLAFDTSAPVGLLPPGLASKAASSRASGTATAGQLTFNS